MKETEVYDLVVLGGGKAGKTLAMDQARAGKKVAMIEQEYIGGSCINVACIPSKTLIASARRSQGIADMKLVQARTAQVVSEMIGYNQGLFDKSGLTLIRGHGRFVDATTIETDTIEGQRRVTAPRIYLNLGTRAAVPLTPGLAEAHPLTHVEALALDRLPQHLVVLGGGSVALEFAQAFRRLGSQVTVVARGPRLMRGEDEDLSAAVHEVLKAEGIDILLNADVSSVSGVSGTKVTLTMSNGTVEGSDLLVAAGRVPQTQGIGLEVAGVQVDGGFIVVDKYLKTTAPQVWALGECAGSPMFTHASLDDFRVAKSGIVGGSRTTEARLVPSCLFIDPEFARVGLSETQARQQGIPYRLAVLPVEVVPRAWTLGERQGLLKALVARDDTILGFAMLGASAGEVVSVVQMAMLGRLPYTALRDGILAHPTMAESLNLLFGNLRPN